ncbi:MAG: acyloxyacyl hydrolase [Alphaproteobacteria bacterium]|nr:acyloxyacyl hydrolase [Alphaproteobacteria bacterium]
MKIRDALFGAALAAGLALPAAAQDHKLDVDLLGLSAGIFDVGDSDRSAEFRLEYRWGSKLFWLIKPFVGAMATGEHARYGYAGLLADFDLGGNFVLTPSLAGGAFARGDGKDLGSGVEFRTQLELAYVTPKSHRVGVAVSHMSNASIGDRNPGANSAVLLSYAIPISALAPK